MSEELSQLDHELLGDVDTSKKNDKTSQSKTSPNIDAPAEPNGIVLNMESVEGTVEASPEDVSISVSFNVLLPFMTLPPGTPGGTRSAESLFFASVLSS